MYGSTAMGPTVGYLIGGYFLRIYVDIDKHSTQQCVCDVYFSLAAM